MKAIEGAEADEARAEHVAREFIIVALLASRRKLIVGNAVLGRPAPRPTRPGKNMLPESLY